MTPSIWEMANDLLNFVAMCLVGAMVGLVGAMVGILLFRRRD